MHLLSSRTGGTVTKGENLFIRFRLLLISGILCLSTIGLLAAPVPSNKPSNYPAWWFSRGAITPLNPANSAPSWPGSYPASDDYAVLNQGQLKNLATQAYNELHSNTSSSVWSTSQGMVLTNLVAGWNPTSGDAYAVVNLGQLKTVAKPFYDVLIQIGFANTYPWTGVGADDYAIANIGQAKRLFTMAPIDLATDLNYEIQTLINAAGSSPSLGLYTTQTGGTPPVATRNTALWASKMIDFTGIPAFFDRNDGNGPIPIGTGQYGSAILISPNDAITAAHTYGVGTVGFKLYYLDNAGVFHIAQVTENSVQNCKNFIPNPDNTGEWLGDICVMHLEWQGSDATTNPVIAGTLKAYKVLPLNWRNYFPSQPPAGFPVIRVNQYSSGNQVCLRNVTNAFGLGTTPASTISGILSIDGGVFLPSRFQWNQTSTYSGYLGVTDHMGDSGSPAFMLINGELVLLTTLTDMNYGASYADLASTVNLFLNSSPSTGGVGSSYSLSTVDLSNFSSSSFTLTNASFETPSVAGGYQYNPIGGTWAFDGSSGIQSNGSAWGAPTAPDGTQTAFLQCHTGDTNGSIFQVVSFKTAGTYTLNFQAALRASPHNGAISFNVLVDNVAVGTFSPTTTTSFTSYSITSTVSTAGNHTVTFTAVSTSTDSSVFIDAVSIH